MSGTNISDRITTAFREAFNIGEPTAGARLPGAMAAQITRGPTTQRSPVPAGPVHLTACTMSADATKKLSKITTADSIKPGLFWLHSDGTLKEATWANGRRFMGLFSKAIAKRNATGQVLAALDFIKTHPMADRVEMEKAHNLAAEALADLHKFDELCQKSSAKLFMVPSCKRRSEGPHPARSVAAL